MTSPHDGIQSGPQEHSVHGDAAHGHHDAHAPAPLPFSDADIADFRKEDVHAGKMIVGLMAGIFSIGIFLYILVMLSTWLAVDATKAL